MKGYDVFYEAPGTVGERTCLVCGTVCNLEKNRVGPTSWAGAIGKIDKVHDYFFCPYLGQEWHDQALELVQAIESMPSKRVAALMQQDLVELLAEHGCKLGI